MDYIILFLHWSPDIIVLGGGLIIGEVISIDSARKYLSEIMKVFPEIPEIKKAELGDMGGLYGVLAFLKII